MIVVTGAAGFIGSNLVRALNARGDTGLLLVDDLGRGEKWRNLPGLRFDDLIGIERFRQLVRDDRLPQDVRAVFHLGACSATDERDADFLLENNYRATRELAELCLRREARFIYASSAATYGGGEHGYDDRDAATPRLRPLNMYGHSKQLFDLWALQTGALARIAGLKYFNVFGPGEDHKGEMRSVVNKAFAQVAATGSIRLFRSYRPDVADGQQQRDFIHVDDAVAQTLFHLDHPQISGLFNCGTGVPRSWLDLARAVFAALGREPKIEFIAMPEGLREKYQYFTAADLTKARAAGYVRSPFTLEAGVAAYWTQVSASATAAA